MNTTSVDNNLGPASIIIVNGEKDLEVACAMIMGEKDVLKNPLNITDAKSHTCEFDAKSKIARRKYDGKVEEANFDIMAEEEVTRKSQERHIEKVPSIPEISTKNLSYDIDENGELVRKNVGMDR